MENRYLTKHARKSALIRKVPAPDLEMVVVIPCFDEPELLTCLDSLLAAAVPEGMSVEVFILINYPESSGTELVRRSHLLQGQLIEYAKTRTRDDSFSIFTHVEVFTDREAGVGLARKMAMDEGVRRFEYLGGDGIIVNLDADCTVEKNYFVAIRAFYEDHPKVWAGGIYFEHKIDQQLSGLQEEAIVEYELHLRYFVEAQRYIHLPFAYQTVGSCMTVRSSAYQKMGGMNTRQAGEDFYFLHKYIAINRFAEINDTTVFPSARASSRVPFGTGRAVNARLQGAAQLTYHMDSFLEVDKMVRSLPDLYKLDFQSWVTKLPPLINDFIIENNGLTKIEEIKRETNRYATFVSRFFQWFNAFRLMKYLHFARTYYPDRPVVEQAISFREMVGEQTGVLSAQELLQWYREKARKTKYP